MACSIAWSPVALSGVRFVITCGTVTSSACAPPRQAVRKMSAGRSSDFWNKKRASSDTPATALLNSIARRCARRLWRIVGSPPFLQHSAWSEKGSRCDEQPMAGHGKGTSAPCGSGAGRECESRRCRCRCRSTEKEDTSRNRTTKGTGCSRSSSQADKQESSSTAAAAPSPWLPRNRAERSTQALCQNGWTTRRSNTRSDRQDLPQGWLGSEPCECKAPLRSGAF